MTPVPQRIALALLALMLGAAPALAADALQDARARGALIMATVEGSPPMSSRGEAGAFVGFDIDVGREIAARLNLEIEYAPANWSELVEGDWRGRWDFTVSSMTPTPQREQHLDFPAVYYHGPVVLAVHEDNDTVTAPAEASEARIGVFANTTYERYLRQHLVIYEGLPAFTYLIDDPYLRFYETQAAALDDLAKGDGAVLDGVVTSYVTAQQAIDDGLPLTIVPGWLFFEPMAVAVQNDQERLAIYLAATVQEMIDDGTITDLSIKWFGIDLVR